MFSPIAQFIKSRIRPSLYTVPDGRKLVVMEADDYEALSGVEASSLPIFEFEASKAIPVEGDVEDFGNASGGAGQTPLPYGGGVDASDNVGNTEGNEKDGTIGSRLASMQLEEEIRIDDLPL